MTTMLANRLNTARPCCQSPRALPVAVRAAVPRRLAVRPVAVAYIEAPNVYVDPAVNHEPLPCAVRKGKREEAQVLASLDNCCKAEGSAGWDALVYRCDLVPDSWNTILVAERKKDNGEQPEVVGLIAGSDLANGEVEVTNMAVRPEVRGHGVGKALLVELLRKLGAQNSRTIVEVPPCNLGARHLFEDLGFEVAGERKRYYGGNDPIIMARPASKLPAVVEWGPDNKW